MSEWVYKICARGEWETAIALGQYAGSADDARDGFIHLSRAHQLAGTQARYFDGRDDCLLITFDAESLGDALRFETSRGGDRFPHFYGSLPTALARSVQPLLPLRSVPPLDNPERGWRRPMDAPELVRALVEERIGPVEDTLVPLSGGLANHNIWLRESGRVLRVFVREPAAAAKEARLLGRAWQHLRVPAVLDRGEDYLLLEYVAHTELPDAPSSGGSCGRALAEIHATRYATAGHFNGDLDVAMPFGDVIEALTEYVASQCAPPGSTGVDALLARTVACLRRERATLEALTHHHVLLHGDFKSSNVHLTPGGVLLVLDWEFAYAGPPWMDIGQLLRWQPSGEFRRAFADAYRAHGRELPAGFESTAALFDLVNLAGLLASSEAPSRRLEDVRRRIELTLAAHGA